MNDSTIERIVKALPKGYRYNLIIAILPIDNFDGMPLRPNLNWYFEATWFVCRPDRNLIQESVGFLKWQTVGEFDDDRDVIILYPGHYRRLMPLFMNALIETNLTGVSIKEGITTPAETAYLKRAEVFVGN